LHFEIRIPIASHRFDCLVTRAVGTDSDLAPLIPRAVAGWNSDHRTNWSPGIHWADITGIVAFRRDIFIGKTVGIAIASKDGATHHVMEGDSGWLDILSAIDRHLPTALPKDQRFLDLASGKREGVEVYRSSVGTDSK
jgi:hypothetical protein